MMAQIRQYIALEQWEELYFALFGNYIIDESKGSGDKFLPIEDLDGTYSYAERRIRPMKRLNKAFNLANAIGVAGRLYHGKLTSCSLRVRDRFALELIKIVCPSLYAYHRAFPGFLELVEYWEECITFPITKDVRKDIRDVIYQASVSRHETLAWIFHKANYAVATQSPRQLQEAAVEHLFTMKAKDQYRKSAFLRGTLRSLVIQEACGKWD